MQFVQVVSKRISDKLALVKASDKATHIKYVLWYSDGRGVETTKGYFLSVYPVKLDGHFEMSYLFSGTVSKLSECNKYNEDDLVMLWTELHYDEAKKTVLRNAVQQVASSNSVEVSHE